MWEDPIVKEVRKAGAKLAEECNYDLHELGEMLREHEEEYKKQGWKLTTKEELEKMEFEELKKELDL